MLKNSVGKIINEIALVNGTELRLTFDDNTQASIFDDGQSCCESRYMHTDDDLTQYVGAKLLGVELREVTHEDEDYDSKDCQFLAVLTDKGNFTIANYNIHNGYYGGFNIIAMES